MLHIFQVIGTGKIQPRIQFFKLIMGHGAENIKRNVDKIHQRRKAQSAAEGKTEAVYVTIRVLPEFFWAFFHQDDDIDGTQVPVGELFPFLFPDQVILAYASHCANAYLLYRQFGKCFR